MVGGVVSVVSGVMNPLIGKLTALMGDEYKKLKVVRSQASFLVKEFRAMNAALQMLEVMDEPDPAVKDWGDHVREMSYDMENCIDDFMRPFGCEDAKEGFIKKTTRRLKRLRQRHQIAARIEELKTLAIEANARHERYKINERYLILLKTINLFVPAGGDAKSSWTKADVFSAFRKASQLHPNHPYVASSY